MITHILTAAGIPHKPARFPDPPTGTYAIYFDDVEVDGPDRLAPGVPRIARHEVTVELYEPAQDDAAEDALEAQLVAQGLTWTKQARYWLDSLRRYQVIYEFSYTIKP